MKRREKGWTRFVEGVSAEDALKQNKYPAEKSAVNGRTFDSGQECNRASLQPEIKCAAMSFDGRDVIRMVSIFIVR
jgi:hypothetical protein